MLLFKDISDIDLPLKPVAGSNKRFSTFAKDISLNMNVIAQLEFKLAYYEYAMKHVSHYVTRTSPSCF